MTWEQKLEAIHALAGFWDVSLKMRKPGDWYITLGGLEIGGDGMLTSVRGNGATPEAAVEDAWTHMTNLPDDRYLVREAIGERRREVRWNGYMWADVLAKRVPA